MEPAETSAPKAGLFPDPGPTLSDHFQWQARHFLQTSGRPGRRWQARVVTVGEGPAATTLVLPQPLP